MTYTCDSSERRLALSHTESAFTTRMTVVDRRSGCESQIRSSDRSRISTLRTFPVTVMGNSSTTWTYRGIL